jgi:preprotein translocase SecF subunit
VFWYHLTRYRYRFFAVSGLIIVPGLLALIFWHLNLGIDFTNGTTVDLVFANKAVSTTQVGQVFTQAHAQDVNVYASSSIGSTVKPDRFVYIQFSRPIGTQEVQNVGNLLADPKYHLPAATLINQNLSYTVNGTDTAQLVYQFASTVSTADVQKALATLPPTDAPPTTGATSTPTVAPTTAPTATPKASPTATPKAGSTPTATATATPATSGPTFPVSVTKITQGQNTFTYQVNTQTDLVNTPQASVGKPSLPQIIGTLQTKFGPVYVQDKSSVSPTIAAQTTGSAFLAVVAASVFILIYIAIAFRKVGSWPIRLRFGTSAIIALLHDALVVVGLWAIFGHFFNFKVDTLFLTAVLTVIGFSVHDTIVVFDRIRENLGRHTSETFDQVMNTSLIQTMTRSLNTSLTVLLVLSAETLFGGASIHEFVMALLIGIASGTYSSIFNASMILSVWENQEYKHWGSMFRNFIRNLFGRGKKPGTPARRSERSLAGTRV